MPSKQNLPASGVGQDFARLEAQFSLLYEDIAAAFFQDIEFCALISLCDDVCAGSDLLELHAVENRQPGRLREHLKQQIGLGGFLCTEATQA